MTATGHLSGIKTCMRSVSYAPGSYCRIEAFGNSGILYLFISYLYLMCFDIRSDEPYRPSRDKLFPTRIAPKGPCREMEFKTNECIAVCSSPVIKYSRVIINWSGARACTALANTEEMILGNASRIPLQYMYRRWEVRTLLIPNSNSAVKPDAFQLGPRLRNICITLKYLHLLMIGLTNMLRNPRWERLARSTIAGMP